MKILYGQELVNVLRSRADKVGGRLWVAVPYIGGPDALRQILGKQWHNSPNISVQLLTDISEPGCINAASLQIFYDRGKIRSLSGLHAKIYIIDEDCLVTSANLTASAFSKRYEMGVWLDKSESGKVIKAFESWWQLASVPSQEDMEKAIHSEGGRESTASGKSRLADIWELPKSPGAFTPKLPRKFRDYDKVVKKFDDFGREYSAVVQRIWPDLPLSFEIDGLFNYLYHNAPHTPSRPYGEKESSPRELTPSRRLAEIGKWAKQYRNFNEQLRRDGLEEDIYYRINSSKVIRRLLSRKSVHLLTATEVEEVLLTTNSISSDHRNKVMIFEKNSLERIKDGLNVLVNGSGKIPARMNYCNQIKNIGPSTMNEIIGYYNPTEYPLVNKNSRSGLRFFGYSVSAYE